MASKKKITPNNIHGWLAAFGYIFPSTEAELLRFERLYADVVIPAEELIDPEVILGRKPAKNRGQVKSIQDNNKASFRMAARNGISNIPKHILDKMIKNQKKPPADDGGSAQE